MIELLPTLTTAIGLANKLGQLSTKLKHAEVMDIVGDLRIELANLKIGTADLLEENDALKRQITSFTSTTGDPCPRCKKRTYHLEKSEKDKTFGVVGGMMRTYLCDNCDFTEQSLVTPGM